MRSKSNKNKLSITENVNYRVQKILEYMKLLVNEAPKNELQISQ